MFSIIIIVFEAITVLFIGIFGRTNDTTNKSLKDSTLFSDSLILMFAFALMYAPFRRLSLFAIVIFLMVLFVSV
jgi:hypothetical protein